MCVTYNVIIFVVVVCVCFPLRNPLSRKGYLDFFGEHEGAWIRKYVVIWRPYILIYNTVKDMVRREWGKGGEGGRGRERRKGGEGEGARGGNWAEGVRRGRHYPIQVERGVINPKCSTARTSKRMLG